MSFFTKAKEWFEKVFFNTEWRCNACGKEIFDDSFFCKDCLDNLPLNNQAICNHCGRHIKASTDYCTTCKNYLTDLDCSRSPFIYSEPISKMIKKVKYNQKKYLLDAFTDYLVNEYYKNYFNSDAIVYIPMTEKAKKKRGYNQSEILAKNISKKINVEVIDALEKVKDTTRQAKLSRNERLLNLQGAFKLKNKKIVKDKSILIVDDVTTTGSTLEAVSKLLKKGGAKIINALTVASVPNKSGY